MNATDKAELLELLPSNEVLESIDDDGLTGRRRLNITFTLAQIRKLRSLLSAQEAEPSAEHGWIPMTTRPKDGQRIVYWFEPFNTAAIGTYHSGLPSDPESFDTVSGRNGFTTVDPECPWWMPTPTDEQRARERARKGAESDERPVITAEMIREAEAHVPFTAIKKNNAYPRWESIAAFLTRALSDPNTPCPCCNVTPAGAICYDLPEPPK